MHAAAAIDQKYKVEVGTIAKLELSRPLIFNNLEKVIRLHLIKRLSD